MCDLKYKFIHSFAAIAGFPWTTAATSTAGWAFYSVSGGKFFIARVDYTALTTSTMVKNRLVGVFVGYANAFTAIYIGDAAFSLWQLNNNDAPDSGCLVKLNRPMPQVELGRSLQGIASACIDISDGLKQDLCHILKASKVSARIEVEKIPLAKVLTDHVNKKNDWSLVLNGGDDYELCFTVPVKNQTMLSGISKRCGVKITQVGVICESGDLEIVGAKNIGRSYQHF